ncbi:MAG: calcium/sodium antiporter [Agarilytica sp.]
MLESIPSIALAAIAIFIGIGGLVWSADRFVAGAASIAESFDIAPIIVGLTIVSFGTSAPEVMVSLMAALDGAGELAVGNALGSNIANIALVLGVTLLISQIPVDSKVLKHEGMVLIPITLLAGYFLYDAELNPIEGWVLLALLLPVMWYLVVVKQKDYKAEELLEEEAALPHYSRGIAMVWFVVGLVALVVSSKVLVWGAVETAVFFNVSPLIIGLTIIAIGTSLPELAASVMSALRGHHDIAVGNIVGSNIFNLLAVMSVPGIFVTKGMDPAVFARDYSSMLAVTLSLFVFLGFAMWQAKRKKKDKGVLGRVSGAILLAAYVAYMLMIAQSQLGI